ncbi:hypothetical protein TSUD_168950 [Trifolium subterraneum]|nr:hypothetical protein TSUD_168950 [Trifolium subterraneum]
MIIPREKTLLYFAFFLFWTSFKCSNALLSSKGVNFEVQALMGIKESLVDPHGVLDNWDGDAVDPCSWTMVTCSTENLVNGLRLNNNSLAGECPESLANMTQLAFL